MLSKMTKAVALSLLLFAAACKKKEESKPAEPKPTEAKPTETTPTPTPTPTPPADPAAAGLSSIAIPNAKTPAPDLLTGGQITEEHVAQAKDKGVKTVVNLRAEKEKAEYEAAAKKVEELGMKYVHIPIDGKTGEGLNEENAKKLAEAIEGDDPAIVHCKSGQRVGALFALKAFYVDKKTPEEAMKVGEEHGLSMPELVKIVQDQMAAAKKG
jgi:uncharacterized protein (TIGR01244 family)